MLSINYQPCITPAPGCYRLRWLEIHSRSNTLRERERRYSTKPIAEAALAQRMLNWRPLTWEVSVDDYRTLAGHLQHACKLFASRAVTFVPRADALHLLLATILGTVPSAAQLAWAAWYLGVWLTDGGSNTAWISQGGAPPPDPQHHQQVMDRLLEYQQLFGERALKVFDRVSSAGHPQYWFQFGGGGAAQKTASIAHRLLQAYGLIGNKHVPQAWICDTLEVRRRIFAGGAGLRRLLQRGPKLLRRPTHASTCLRTAAAHARSLLVCSTATQVTIKRHRVALGLKQLAGSLGLRNSAAYNRWFANQETGVEYDGYLVRCSGDMWDVVQYCALTHKQCPAPGQPNYVAKGRASRCYGFDIEPLPVGDYHGFSVHGGANQRILLADFTVTHNVMRAARILPSVLPAA